MSDASLIVGIVIGHVYLFWLFVIMPRQLAKKRDMNPGSGIDGQR